MTDLHAPAATPLTKPEIVAMHFMVEMVRAAWTNPDIIAGPVLGSLMASDAFVLADAFLAEGERRRGGIGDTGRKERGDAPQAHDCD